MELQNLHLDSASIKKTLTFCHSAGSLTGRHWTRIWALRDETNPTHQRWHLGDEGKLVKGLLGGCQYRPLSRNGSPHHDQRKGPKGNPFDSSFLTRLIAAFGPAQMLPDPFVVKFDPFDSSFWNPCRSARRFDHTFHADKKSNFVDLLTWFGVFLRFTFRI